MKTFRLTIYPTVAGVPVAIVSDIRTNSRKSIIKKHAGKTYNFDISELVWIDGERTIIDNSRYYVSDLY
jgi:hypothetical protein